jgi:hypothetical protein
MLLLEPVCSGPITREKIRSRRVGDQYASHERAEFHHSSRSRQRLATLVPRMASQRWSRSRTRRKA